MSGERCRGRYGLGRRGARVPKSEIHLRGFEKNEDGVKLTPFLGGVEREIDQVGCRARSHAGQFTYDEGVGNETRRRKKGLQVKRGITWGKVRGEP